MNDKFDMKLVIDAVTTPLLHARLSQAASFRERAALLRFLAESALRGEVAYRRSVQPGGGVESSRTSSPTSTAPSHSSPPDMPRSALAREASGDYETQASNDEADAAHTHDINQIADAFGSFFEAT